MQYAKKYYAGLLDDPGKKEYRVIHDALDFIAFKELSTEGTENTEEKNNK
jgi:hypothetical protein